MTAEARVARQWVAKARSDLLNVENNLRSNEIPFDTVCFHCQQAAEKLLKAFLVLRGGEALRSHDLLLLLEQVLEHDGSAESLRESLAVLVPYAVEIRYPDDWHMPSADDTTEARQATERVLAWVKTIAPELFSA